MNQGQSNTDQEHIRKKRKVYSTEMIDLSNAIKAIITDLTGETKYGEVQEIYSKLISIQENRINHNDTKVKDNLFQVLLKHKGKLLIEDTNTIKDKVNQIISLLKRMDKIVKENRQFLP